MAALEMTFRERKEDVGEASNFMAIISAILGQNALSLRKLYQTYPYWFILDQTCPNWIESNK